MHPTCVVAVLIFFQFLSHAAKLPDYIERCSLSDPKIGDCLMDRFGKVKPHILNGVKEFHIPKLTPLHLEKINIEATKTLNVTLTDVYIYGLENAIETSAIVDTDSSQAAVELIVPSVFAKAHYDITGQLMFLPITGNGPATMNITNAFFGMNFTWHLVERDGVDYCKIAAANLKYKTERTWYHLDNLFNGNKQLGDEMNAFIDENWKEFSKEIEPAVSQTLLQIIWHIFDGVSDSVPFSELFLP